MSNLNDWKRSWQSIAYSRIFLTNNKEDNFNLQKCGCCTDSKHTKLLKYLATIFFQRIALTMLAIICVCSMSFLCTSSALSRALLSCDWICLLLRSSSAILPVNLAISSSNFSLWSFAFRDWFYNKWVLWHTPYSSTSFTTFLYKQTVLNIVVSGLQRFLPQLTAVSMH